MRTLLQNQTPLQLLWLIAASNIIVSMSFGILEFRSWQHHHLSDSLLWISFGMLILGVVGDLIAEQALRDGISAEYWPGSLLDGPRKLFAGPAFPVLNVLFLVAGCAYIAFSPARSFGGAWAFLFPGMSLPRIIGYMRRKSPPSTDRLFLQREPPKPLHSEHWKTPPRPFAS